MIFLKINVLHYIKIEFLVILKVKIIFGICFMSNSLIVSFYIISMLFVLYEIIVEENVVTHYYYHVGRLEVGKLNHYFWKGLLDSPQ